MNNSDFHQGKAHILLVEDHAIVRLATKFLVEQILQEVAVYEAAGFEAAITCLKGSQIDLILLDIQLKDGLGVGMIAQIRQLQPKVLILVFSALDEQIYALHYIKAGANGYLSKDSSQNQIEFAILATLREQRYVSDAMRSRILIENMYPGRIPENPLEALSVRELEVMDMLLAGYWVKEIAMLFGVTESSVSTYKNRIFEKLGVTTLIDLFKEVNRHKDKFLPNVVL